VVATTNSSAVADIMAMADVVAGAEEGAAPSSAPILSHQTITEISMARGRSHIRK